jgi:hypothetical protein
MAFVFKIMLSCPEAIILQVFAASRQILHECLSILAPSGPSVCDEVNSPGTGTLSTSLQRCNVSPNTKGSKPERLYIAVFDKS